MGDTKETSSSKDVFARSCKTPRSPENEPETSQVEKKRKSSSEQTSEQTLIDIYSILQKMSKENEDIRRENKEFRNEIAKLNENFEVERRQSRLQREQMVKKVDAMEGRIRELEDRLERRESIEKSRNIIVRGVGEKEGEDPEETKRKLMEMIEEKINIRPNILFAKRIGKKIENRSRTIMASFSQIEEKRVIMRNKFKLKGTRVFIEDDYTEKIIRIRQRLFEHAKKLRDQGQRVKVIRNKIIINNVLHELVMENGSESLVETKNL